MHTVFNTVFPQEWRFKRLSLYHIQNHSFLAMNVCGTRRKQGNVSESIYYLSEWISDVFVRCERYASFFTGTCCCRRYSNQDYDTILNTENAKKVNECFSLEDALIKLTFSSLWSSVTALNTIFMLFLEQNPPRRWFKFPLEDVDMKWYSSPGTNSNPLGVGFTGLNVKVTYVTSNGRLHFT